MIYKYQDYINYELMSNDFINSFHILVTEDFKKSKYKESEKKIISDLKLNFNLVGIYGAGIPSLYPIVEKLMKGSNVEINPETVVLSTITAITIIFLEEKKVKNIEKYRKMIKDSKSLLEELRMRGIGDGIIKKLIKSLYAIKNIFSIIGKHIGAVIGGFMDIFSYISLMIPILNGVLFILEKYDMNMDNIIQNFIGLSMGVGTIIAKHGIIDIINNIKGKYPLNKKEILDELETPVIQKFGNIKFGNDSENPKESDESDMIKEQ